MELRQNSKCNIWQKRSVTFEKGFNQISTSIMRNGLMMNITLNEKGNQQREMTYEKKILAKI